ncbi:CDP-glucose 4,6-dehydratase [Desulfovibrio falkowii]|uniref:CDP-glucose 4,6-dehydratase n=1 Tax=Desulfovibrio falkowii TaxID=3136602 RepID=A0ABQ0E7F6_9BACT
MIDLAFFKGKRIFLTGHTGFKGAWLSRVLLSAGAEVTGYSLKPEGDSNLFDLSGVSKNINNIFADIRDFHSLRKAFTEARPDIVIHFAAQPIVRASYIDPVYTYETNVLGTVYLLECARQSSTVRSVLNITTDKVYNNKEWVWGYREQDFLDGYDPYSNSKSCAELVTHSYARCFFKGEQVPVSTARAGNVIGGGDFAKDRIIPDCIRAQISNQAIRVRNPHGVRPYQHVLEPLFAYLLLVMRQYDSPELADAFNIGPEEIDCIPNGALVDLFCQHWGNGATWIDCSEKNAPHEATLLKLDCRKIMSTLNWRPRWHIAEAVAQTCAWSKVWLSGGDIPAEMDRQISLYNSPHETFSDVTDFIHGLHNASLDGSEGLPEELFLFISSITPIPNVDLFIQDKHGRLLLSWRDDAYYGKGWHIPGGCIRYGQSQHRCIADTSLRELGIEVSHDSEPIITCDAFRPQCGPHRNPRVRGHNITTLYRCYVPDDWEPPTAICSENGGPKPGEFQWFEDLPPDLLPIHHCYGDILQRELIKGKKNGKLA